MRIPPSVIVMSLVTAVPFAFAVRATVLHRDGSVDDEARARAEAEQQAREYEAQELREAQIRDEQKAHQRKRIAELFGATPASFGPLFDGVALGAPEATIDADHARNARLLAYMSETHVNIRNEWDTTLTKVHIGSADSEVCTAMSDRLDATWHDSVTAENGDEIWLDATTRQRAVFRSGSAECSVDVTRYVPVDDWFARSPTSIVPLWAIGQRVDRLEAALDGRAHSSEPDSIEWVAPGPGAGTDATRLVAEIEDGRVVAVTAWSMTAPATTDAIARRLEQVLVTSSTAGASPRPSALPNGSAVPSTHEGNKETWSTTRPPVTLTTDNGVSVRVGRAPKDDAALDKIDL